MTTLPPSPRLASAAAVFCGRRGDVTRLATQRGTYRQALYREARAVARDLDAPPAAAEAARWRQRAAELQAQLERAEQRLGRAVVVDADKQAEFAATAQAVGVSLSATRALLAVLLGAAAPSTATLGRLTRAAGRRAGAVLAVLDGDSAGRARQVAADEIFSGRRPILMTVEQDSLCWLGGRLAANRDGPEWAAEFRRLPNAEQVTADGGQGIRKGLDLVNAERAPAGRPALADQRDHFHALQRARRALRTARHQAAQALAPAARAQRAYDRAGRAGVPRSAMQGRQRNQAWAKAERAFDRWSAQDRAFARLRRGLPLFTPEGELNTRERAEAEVGAALAGQPGPDWARARRLLGPEAFTFLDRAAAQLAALPVDPDRRQAALRVEGLRRRPEALRGEGPAARLRRGLVLAAQLVLALAGPAGQQAQALVRGVLDGAWRCSSLVEGINSVVRMHQARQKRLTQELLDLKRLHWNLHVFRAGKRKGTSPLGRLGVAVPPGGWWALLQQTPEQLRLELSQLNPAA